MIWQIIPWFIAGAILLLLGTSAPYTARERQPEPRKLSSPAQYFAACSHNLRSLEAALDPKSLLDGLVKQQGQTWLHIGAGSMEHLGNTDYIKQLLDRVPTWKKVSDCRAVQIC